MHHLFCGNLPPGTRPLSHLINAFKEMETGNFKVQIANVHSPDFAYLYQEFNKMAQKLELLIEKDYTQKLLLQKAELKQLQAQINPHFLYNTLNTISAIAEIENMENIVEITDSISNIFRYNLKGDSIVTLREEIGHVKDYVQIQKSVSLTSLR